MQSKFVLLPGLAAGFGANPLRAQPAPEAQIPRGKDLVENVAVWTDCHTPRDEKGQFDRTQWLQGNVLDIKPDPPAPFAAAAITIAGLAGLTDEPALWPMPQFRSTHDDAVVLAYLSPLKH